ncbi:hypothetical protein AC623_18585 [Bacillus sp. FJAT-27231]|uniref:hypothetical protein n=1 Tax=Bacillus sp. FJAT-27231 TaxID=1679168 RepID=UPI00067164E7|nr:hypothetical protein [Bacillus sp. FJAT-27231]KMY55693.1 hypothetical protein AC623_18585 [Bacillus sp. FJAT-27231]
MKQILNCILLGVYTLAASWLYQIQLGAVAFLLLSFFLFYRTFIELRKMREGKRPSPEAVSKKVRKKKAEIVT